MAARPAAPMNNQRAAALAEAETWLGTPFEHATMIRGRGVDCVMLLVASFRAAGILPADFDPRPYPRTWFLHRDDERYVLGIEEWALPVEHPEPGDVGVWKFGRCYSHGGLLVTPFVGDANPYRQRGDVIHAYQPGGKVSHDPLTFGDLLFRPCKWFSPYSE